MFWFVIINFAGDNMIYTLDYLKKHVGNSINEVLDFKKELETIDLITDIGPCHVNGTYQFIYSRAVEFILDIKVDITITSADTLNPILYPLHFTITEEVSDTSDAEFKISEDKINLYELVWGWLVAEIPYVVYEL